MKYGALFSLLSAILCTLAVTRGQWFLILLWPAASFAVVAAAYLGFGHRLFGKRSDGSMSPVSVCALLPYLVSLWTLWHVIRTVSREAPFNAVTEGLMIGRRLLSREVPPDMSTVVDLTCEFPEPAGLRDVARYISCPLLDAEALNPETLADFARDLAKVDDPVFIHCAQGHGRTGLIAALLLIARGHVTDPEAALRLVRAARPAVKLNRIQRNALVNATTFLRSDHERGNGPFSEE